MVITIANQKGGVGKTTTAVTLAHGLALKNHKVLLVDLDPQGHCATLLGMGEEPGVFDLLVNDRSLREVTRFTGRPALWLIPSNKKTATAQVSLVLEGYRHTILLEALAPAVNGRVHYTILDTAPSAGGGLQENALYMANLIIIPSAVDYLSLDGIAKVLKTLNALHRPKPPVLWIVPTFYDEVTRESRANLAMLRDRFGDRVKRPIHRATALREAAAAGRTIFECAPDSRAAEEYAALVWEVLNAGR